MHSANKDCNFSTPMILSKKLIHAFTFPWLPLILSFGISAESKDEMNSSLARGGGGKCSKLRPISHLSKELTYPFVSTIFASSTRVAKPLDYLKLKKEYHKPSFCDVLGSILYDSKYFKIDFLEKHSKSKRNTGIQGFFSWLDQYI